MTRRAELIHKKHLGGGLTRAEEAELRKLQQDVSKRLAMELRLKVRHLRKVAKEAK